MIIEVLKKTPKLVEETKKKTFSLCNIISKNEKRKRSHGACLFNRHESLKTKKFVLKSKTGFSFSISFEFI